MILGIVDENDMTLVEAMIDQWQQVFPGWVMGRTWYAHSRLRPEYQMELWGWGADYPDPQDFLGLLWTTRAQYNLEHVSLSDVDELLAQADGMSDQRMRFSLYQQAEQLLVNKGAAIPLFQNIQTYAVRAQVSGWRIAPTGVTPLSVWQSPYIKR